MVREEDLTIDDRDKTRHGRLTLEQVKAIRVRSIEYWKEPLMPEMAKEALEVAILCHQYQEAAAQLNDINEKNQNTLKGIVHRWPRTLLGCLYFSLTVATGLGAVVCFAIALHKTSPPYLYTSLGNLGVFMLLISGVFSGIMQLFFDD
jgi:hypothetical protein